MAQEPIPEDIRRFILASIPSVPYLEALLLIRAETGRAWDRKSVADRLYTNEKAADELLAELCKFGAAVADPLEQGKVCYRYSPKSEELQRKIDRLADVYSKSLVEVASLIHSKLDRKAQHFADAFKWRKD